MGCELSAASAFPRGKAWAWELDADWKWLVFCFPTCKQLVGSALLCSAFPSERLLGLSACCSPSCPECPRRLQSGVAV